MTGWPDGVALRRHDTVDSTNEEARRLAASGEAGPVWIVAREQTTGRGRRGRSWVSQAGNLFATLLLRAPLPKSPQLGFAASLALYDVVTAYEGVVSVALKWPNDVLLEGRKVAGILLESLGHDALAIGIGLNLAHHPEDTEFPATSLMGVTGRAPDPESALSLLARRMAAWYEVWQSEGFERLRDAWIASAAGLGQPVRARLPEGEMQGVFENLDGDGALLLRQASGALLRITAADVFFRA